jgi:peptidoglycan hydrolase-like protein with peptidoglycan-binding domain
MDPPGGQGPWFVGLLQCGESKFTLCAHTFPQLWRDAKNHLNQKEKWILVAQIGPFDMWSNALQFYNDWNTCKTIEKGESLAREKNVNIWKLQSSKQTLKADPIENILQKNASVGDVKALLKLLLQ